MDRSMDFHSLSRRELQALCKKNKIPANITNLAMADALNALHSVEGLEDVLLTEKTSLGSPAKTEMKQSIPRTSCRTSIRRKPVREEPQTTQISTRTRGRARRAPADQEEENAAPVDMVCRKMESQLKEVADDEKIGEETPAAMTVVSSRKMGMTSVREAYSTRRSTRLLEKKMTGLNLDDVDDDQIVEGDSQAVEELKSNEELVVIDKEMEIEGINREKMDTSDVKHAALFEDKLMGDNNEEHNLKVELPKKSEVLDESVDDKDSKAEVFDENKGYLNSELTKNESSTDGPTGCLVLENEAEAASFDHLEIDQESPKATDVMATLIGEEKPKGEDLSPYQLGNKESLALNEIVTDLTNKDESKREKSMIMVGSQISEVDEGLTEHSTGLNQLPIKENIALETGSEENSDQPIDVFKMEDTAAASENFDQVSSSPVISENKIADHSEAEIGKKEENIETESPKAAKDHPTDLNMLPFKENIAFETGCEEKSDQPIDVFEMEAENFDQVSSWPVISENKIVDQSEAETGGKDENIETKSPKATEQSSMLQVINKENFVKEKVEKVKMATTDMSMRQLKKMLKQLQISTKKSGTKEDENIAKEMGGGGGRLALQPLSDNCLTTSERENEN